MNKQHNQTLLFGGGCSIGTLEMIILHKMFYLICVYISEFCVFNAYI